MKETALSGFLYHALEELDALAALFQGNNSLLLGGGVTAVHALAAVTAAHVDGVNLLDLDAEQLLLADYLSDGEIDIADATAIQIAIAD